MTISKISVILQGEYPKNCMQTSPRIIQTYIVGIERLQQRLIVVLILRNQITHRCA